MTSCKTTNFPNGVKVGECLELDGEVETPFLNKETLTEQNVASDVDFAGTVRAKEFIADPASLTIGSNKLDQAGVFLQQSSDIDDSTRFLIGRDFDDSGSLPITSELIGELELVTQLPVTGTRLTISPGLELTGASAPAGVFAYQMIIEFFVYDEILSMDIATRLNSFDPDIGTLVSTVSDFSSLPPLEFDITNITQANPAVVTSPGHTYSSGERIGIGGVTVGMTEINDLVSDIAVSGDDITFTSIDSTSFTAYVSGGNTQGHLVSIPLDNPLVISEFQDYFTTFNPSVPIEVDGGEVAPSVVLPFTNVIGQSVLEEEIILTNSDIGIDVGDIVQLEDVGGMAGLPAVDGSQLTNISPKDSDDIENVSTVSGSTVTDALDNLNSGLGEVNTSSNSGAGAGLALSAAAGLVTAVRPLKLVVRHGVRPVGDHVEAYLYQTAAAHLAQHDVAVLVVVVAARVLVVVAASLAADAHDAVARHPLQDRPQAVGAVRDTFDAGLPFTPPRRDLVQLLQLMQVFALGVVERSEQPAPAERTDEDVRARVGVVLGHHVDGAALVAGDHQLAAFLHIHSGRHLTEDVDALVDGHQGLRNVELHGTADDHRIELGSLDHRGVVGVLLPSAELLSALVECVLVYVADGVNACSVCLEAGAECPAATCCPDDPNVHSPNDSHGAWRPSYCSPRARLASRTDWINRLALSWKMAWTPSRPTLNSSQTSFSVFSAS